MPGAGVGRWSKKELSMALGQCGTPLPYFTGAPGTLDSMRHVLDFIYSVPREQLSDCLSWQIKDLQQSMPAVWIQNLSSSHTLQ